MDQEWFWAKLVLHFSGRKAEEEAEKQRKIDEEKKACFEELSASREVYVPNLGCA